MKTSVDKLAGLLDLHCCGVISSAVDAQAGGLLVVVYIFLIENWPNLRFICGRVQEIDRTRFFNLNEQNAIVCQRFVLSLPVKIDDDGHYSLIHLLGYSPLAPRTHQLPQFQIGWTDWALWRWNKNDFLTRGRLPGNSVIANDNGRVFAWGFGYY